MPFADMSFGEKFVFDTSGTLVNTCCAGHIELKITLSLIPSLSLVSATVPRQLGPGEKITLFVRKKCIHRSDNPIEFGGKCCGGQDIYDCAHYDDRCIPYPHPSIAKDVHICQNCDFWVVDPDA